MEIPSGTSGLIPRLPYGSINRKAGTDGGSEIQTRKDGISRKNGTLPNPAAVGEGSKDGSGSPFPPSFRDLEGVRVRDMSDLLSSEEKDMLARLFPSSNLTRGIRAYKTNPEEGIRGPRLGGTVDVRK